MIVIANFQTRSNILGEYNFVSKGKQVISQRRWENKHREGNQGNISGACAWDKENQQTNSGIDWAEKRCHRVQSIWRHPAFRAARLITSSSERRVSVDMTGLGDDADMLLSIEGRN